MPDKPEIKPERAYVAYEKAIAPLANIAHTTAAVSREQMKETWRALTMQFGGFGEYDAFNELNLELKLKFGLVAENEVNCHVEIKIDGQDMNVDINSATVGLGTKVLQPALPESYQYFLERNAGQQIKDGFKFMYQYGKAGEPNPLANFWTQIVEVIVSNLDTHVVQQKFAGNRLNPFAIEVLRLTLSLSINTVLENYFLNRTVPEEAYRHQYIASLVQSNEGFVDPSRIHNSFELSYFAAMQNFMSEMSVMDYEEAHNSLLAGELAAKTDLGRMYRHFLETRTHSVNPNTNEIKLPPLNYAMLQNYNPAVLLALANHLWEVLRRSDLAPGVTDQQKRSYVIERVLGYQEVVSMQNQLLTNPASNPIALDMTNKENQRITIEALDNFMRIYFV